MKNALFSISFSLAFPFVVAFGQDGAPKVSIACNIKSDQVYLGALLREAISSNDERCAREALRNGARPSGTYMGRPHSEPIIIAAANRVTPGIIDALFEARLDPKSDEVRRALLRIAGTGQELALERMLAAKVPVDLRGEDGETALGFAASAGTLQTLKLLLENGADVNATTETGLTPLMMVSDDRQKIRELLKRGAKLDAVDRNGRSAIFFAILNFQTNKLSILLEAGANPRLSDTRGDTPMTLARKLKSREEKQAMIALLEKWSQEK